MNELTTWHCSKKILTIGVTCLVFFSAVGLSSVWLASTNADNSFPNPEFAATTFGLFWACAVMLAGYLLLFYQRYRLSIDDTTIRQRGVFTDRTVSMRTIDKWNWRRFPAGGSVRVADHSNTIKIDFGNFTKEHRDQLIDLLRDSISKDKQLGWDEFKAQFESTPKKRAAAQRSRRCLIIVFLIHAIVFSLMGVMGMGVQFVVAALLNGVMMVYLLRSAKQAPDVDAELLARESV